MKTTIPGLTGFLFLISMAAFTQPGSLDTSFGNDGKKIKPSGKGYAMAIQTDGKIVMCGSHGGNLMVARYLSNGSVDKSFGNNGSAVMDFGVTSKAFSIAIQANGKIVAAGIASRDFAVARFQPDGRPDSSFGVNGKVTTDFVGYKDVANFVTIQPDNKILVIGAAYEQGYELSRIALARYNTDGSLDTGFGNAGKLRAYSQYLFDEGATIILQPGGKIVAVGFAYVPLSSPQDFVLIRFHANGNLDSSFGTNGYTFTNFQSFDFPIAAAVQHKGKIVVAGYGHSDFFHSVVNLARYTKDGLPDSSFGTNGKVTTSIGGFDDEAYGLAIQPDNKIVVSGSAADTTGANFFVARLTTNGNMDKSFGVNGITITDFGSNDIARSVALQPDGKIVAAGYSGSDFALARYNGDNAVFNNAGNQNITPSKKLNDKLIDMNIKISPNPVQSILNFEFNKTTTVQKRISIYNVSGRLLISRASDGNTRLDVKQLTAGTYLIKINDENGKELYRGKLIKQ